MRIDNFDFIPSGSTDRNVTGSLRVQYRDDNYNYCNFAFNNQNFKIFHSEKNISHQRAVEIATEQLKRLVGAVDGERYQINWSVFSPRYANATAVYGDFTMNYGERGGKELGEFRMTDQKFGIGGQSEDKTFYELYTYVHNNLQRLFDSAITLSEYND